MQHILSADFIENPAYIDLRNKPRTFSPESYDRTLIKGNLSSRMVQERGSEQARYRTTKDDDFIHLSGC
jgi:hypothetical protein